MFYKPLSSDSPLRLTVCFLSFTERGKLRYKWEEIAQENVFSCISVFVFFLLVQGQRSFIPKTDMADFKLGRPENNIPESG